MLEIERKFLVDKKYLDKIKSEAISKDRIKQAYLHFDKEKSIRVRISNEKKSKLTIKKQIGDSITIREEYEYDIPLRDANSMIFDLPSIDKTRYIIPYYDDKEININSMESLKWEIDIFHDRDLIIAEIELSSIVHKIVLPEWIGKEVSNDPKYLNCNLLE